RTPVREPHDGPHPVEDAQVSLELLAVRAELLESLQDAVAHAVGRDVRDLLPPRAAGPGGGVPQERSASVVVGLLGVVVVHENDPVLAALVDHLFRHALCPILCASVVVQTRNPRSPILLYPSGYFGSSSVFRRTTLTVPFMTSTNVVILLPYSLPCPMSQPSFVLPVEALGVMSGSLAHDALGVVRVEAPVEQACVRLRLLLGVPHRGVVHDLAVALLHVVDG